MLKKVQVYSKSRNVSTCSIINFGLGNVNDNLVDVLYFSFDDMVDGTGELLTSIVGEDGVLAPFPLTKEEDGYSIEVTTDLLKRGGYKAQLQIINGETIWHSNIFEVPVNESLDTGTGTMPSGVEIWLKEADKVLYEVKELEEEIQSNEETRQANEQAREEYVNNLKSEVESGVHDGATFIPDVDSDGNISWSNNKELVNPLTRNIRGPVGPVGPAGSLKVRIATSLPEVGESGVLYLIEKEEREEADIYDEYMWIDEKWELIGSRMLDVDLSNYYTKAETDKLIDDKIGDIQEALEVI